MTHQQTKKHKYRNPEARKLHEERAFKLKIRSDKRVPHVEDVSVEQATRLLEEEQDE